MTSTDRTEESAVAEAFAERMIGTIDSASLTILLSIGHRTGLFDRLAELPPATSAEVAVAAGLQERYVREWLNGVSIRGVVEYDPDAGTYWLPREHAACLTTAAGPGNLAGLAQMPVQLATVEDRIVDCFRTGGGVGYDAYARMLELKAEDSVAVMDAGLLQGVVPAIPGLAERLTGGATLADVGCGAGHAINLLARAFPSSRFVGIDFDEPSIATARAEAAEWGHTNAEFRVADVAGWDEEASYDVVTAIDAIHDQAHPATVLQRVYDALRPGGMFVMVDIKASSKPEENTTIPWATFLYTVSLMHCMTVSLAHGGEGLGTAWGRQVAEHMLAEAGFNHVAVLDPEIDPFNLYYVAHKA